MTFVTLLFRKLDWRKVQLEDSHLQKVYRLKTTTNEPPAVCDEYSTTVKRITGHWEYIVIKDDVLYRRIVDDADKVHFQFIVL